MAKSVVLIFSMLLFSVSVFAGVNLPRTGQYASYFPVDDGEIQAGLTWPNPRFTTYGSGTLLDGLTGLVWVTDANIVANRDPGFDQDISSGDGEITFQHALDYIAKLNGENYLGYSDWRLPNRKELMSLIDFARFDPALPLYHPFTSVQISNYWTSTTYSTIPSQAWTVDLSDGLLWYENKSSIGNVWPVRTG